MVKQIKLRSGADRLRALEGGKVVKIIHNRIYLDNDMYIQLDEGVIDKYDPVKDMDEKYKDQMTLMEKLYHRKDILLQRKNVQFKDLEMELSKVIGQFNLENFKASPFTKFRINTWGHRVRDFNFFNFELVTHDDKVEFKFKHKGEPHNHQSWDAPCDIILDAAKACIYIDVHGRVLNGDGLERYKWREDELEESKIKEEDNGN